MNEQPFSYKTLFNFMNRLSEYYDKTKINLMELLLQQLTLKHIKKYELKTDIQYGKSIFLDSNIKNITRLQLLIEILRKMLRVLNNSDIEDFKGALEKYNDPQKY